jgi:hypothetical protein
MQSLVEPGLWLEAPYKSAAIVPVATASEAISFDPNQSDRRTSSGRSNPPKRGGMTITFTFDTLGYSKRLQDAGVPRPQAEAHAEAARDFIMHELVTEADLALALENFQLGLTIRLSSTIGAGIAALVVLQCLR